MVRRMRTIKMKRLTAIRCTAILLLFNLKGFDCVDNTTIPAPTLILLPSKDPSPTSSNCCPYGGMTSSQLALLSATDDLAPSESVPAIVLLINALPTAPFSLSCLPPQTLCCILKELARKPSLMNAIEPPNVVCLFDILCALPRLMRAATECTIRDLITAAMLSPKIVDAMQPSTVVCLLSKATPTTLCALSPTIRASLIHCALSPTALGRLTQVEISNLVDALMCTDRALARSMSTAEILELLNITVLSPSFAHNMSANRAVDLLCLLSKSAMVPKDLVDALLEILARSAYRLSPTILARLMAVLTCSPYSINSMDPAKVAMLMAAWSQAGVLSTCPPNVFVRLLVVLSQATSPIAVDAIIRLLYVVTCESPSLMCDVPTCVRSAYVIRFTSPEMTTELSIETIVKLIGVLSKNQCFMTELTASSLNLTVTCVVSNGTLFNAFQPSDIVDLLHALVGTGCALQDISPEIIQTLLSFLDSVFSLRALDTFYLSKLLSCFCRCPYLTSAMSGTQLVNVLETITTVSSALQAIPNSGYVNMMTQLMTTPYLMSDIIPFATLLNFMKQIERHTSGSVFCDMPPCVIDKFTEFLGANNASIITSLPPADLKALVGLLTDVHCFLVQLPVKTLSALLEAIYESSIAIPYEVRIKMIFAILRLPPSVMCSLPPESIGNICKSFGSFDALQGGLSTACLGELLTAISKYPCLLYAFDPPMIQDFLEYLSMPQVMLNNLEPCDVTNLVISMSADAHLKRVMPVGCFVRFLRTLNVVMPCSIPTTAAVAMLESLKSMDVMMDGLTLMEATNLTDLFVAETPLLAASPTILANLMTGMTNRFAGIPRESIVHLLAATHLASPCMLCTVPEDVLADLLKLICTQSAIGCLPSEYVAVLMAVLSTTPCLMNAMSAHGLETLMGLILSQPALTAEVVPPHTLADLCTTLALTPSLNVNVSTIILFLSSACPKSVCDIPAMALSTLLEPLSDAKIVYELGVTTTTSFLCLAASSPCILEVLSGPTLNTIVVKLASSPHLIQHLQPDILQCFVAAVACSRPALESLRQTTIAHLLTSIAEGQPCILSTMSPATATALLGAFSSQPAFASLPPPVLDCLIGLLVKFCNLLNALPVSVLNDLFLFFCSAPAVLGSIMSCTLLKFMAILSSMPQLLRALPPSTLPTFIEELCTVSPKFLCAFPAPVVTALFEAVAAGPALSVLTPCTVASLMSAFNTSSCLIPILPAPLLAAFLAYLANNPCLLSDTPRPTLLAFVRNVQSPGSIPPVVFPVGCCLPCVTIDHFGDVSANNNSSCSSGEIRILPAGNTTDSSNLHPNPIIIHPGNQNGTSTVWCFPKKP